MSYIFVFWNSAAEEGLRRGWSLGGSDQHSKADAASGWGSFVFFPGNIGISSSLSSKTVS